MPRHLVATLTFAVALAAPALADEIIFPEGRAPLKNVEIVSESYESVVYKIAGSNQTEPTANILRLVRTNKTLGYITAEKKFAKGDFRGSPGQKGALEEFKSVLADRMREDQAWMKHYALFYVAECYRLSGDAAAGVAAFEAVLRDDERSRFYAQVKLGIGQCKLVNGDMEGARRAFSELEGEAKSKKLGDRWGEAASLALAEVYEAEGKLEEALSRYTKVANARGASAARAGINADRLRAKIDPSRADMAERGLTAAIEAQYANKTEGPDLEVVAAAYNALGDVYTAKSEHKKALLAYLRVATDESLKNFANERPKALYCAAQAFEKAKPEDWQNRAAILRAELRNYPLSPWAQKR